MALPSPPPGWPRYEVKRSDFFPARSIRILDQATKQELFFCRARKRRCALMRPDVGEPWLCVGR